MLGYCRYHIETLTCVDEIFFVYNECYGSVVLFSLSATKDGKIVVTPAWSLGVSSQVTVAWSTRGFFLYSGAFHEDKFKARLSTQIQFSQTYLPLEKELTELVEGPFEEDLSF